MQVQEKFKSRDLETRLWSKLQAKHGLSDDQIEKLKKFYEFLSLESKKTNLIGHTDFGDIASNLFSDSLFLKDFIDLGKVSSIADVGTGAGFPGLVLKILKPDLKLFLIEVKNKKIQFLKEAIELLGFSDVEIVDVDWRTFNRRTNFDIDLFVSKAAFGEDEICRMFRQNGQYKGKQLVYWASKFWQCRPNCSEYVKDVFEYKNGSVVRKLVVFGADQS